MRARRVVAAVAVAVLCLPGVGLAQTDPREDLDDTREELGGAERSLAEVDAVLATAERDLSLVAERLADATADLIDVEAALAAADDALVAAAGEATREAAQLTVATTALDEARADRQDAVATVRRSVRATYIRGPAAPLEGLLRSQTVHQFATTSRALATIAANDRDALTEARVATEVESARRSTVAGTTRTAQRTEVTALDARRRVALLVDAQRRLFASIDEDRALRQETLAIIEGDRAVTARLVDQLRDRVAALESELADALLAADPDAILDGPRPAWASVLPPRGADLSPAIVGAAARVGVDARLFAALVWSESNFNAGAVSSAGALGLSQLMPATAAGLAVDPYDPFENLEGGARFLRAQLERFGRADLALAAYNAGPGAVERYGRTVPPFAETQVYVVRVLQRFEALAAAS